MTRTSRVSWRDGAFLYPHHFQQLERASEATLNQRLEAVEPLGWGVLESAFKPLELSNGQLELERLIAILPDGTPVRIPQNDPPPPSRQLELPVSGASRGVSLALPRSREGYPQVTSSTDRADIRYIERTVEVGDNAEPDRKKSLRVESPNFQLIYDDEPATGQVRLPLARVRRSESGAPELDPDFIPPALRLKASPRLERLARDIVGLVCARARSLSLERSTRGESRLEPVEPDLLSFHFLHSLNQARLELRNLLEQPGVHPARLFEALLRLEGSLSTFTLRLDDNIPYYQHARPEACFPPLEARLREAIGHHFAPRYELIPLQRTDHVWSGQIPDDGRLRERGQFFLAVMSGLPASEVVKQFPGACKLAEQDQIRDAINRYVGAGEIKHISRPPPGVPLHSQAVYFSVDVSSAEWKAVAQTGRVAIYVASFLGEHRLELIGLRPEQR